jgi:hypothetical protein
MMKADPADQIMMIKRAAGEAGLEFDKLNIGYKRLLAEYFGGDITKAQAFFNANIAEAQGLMDKAVESEKELEERKKNNVAFQEKLNALIDNMKVGLMPILDMLNPIVSGMSKFLSFPGGPMIMTLGMIAGSMALLRAAIGAVTATVVQKIQAFNVSGVAAQNASQQGVIGEEKETAAVNTTNGAIQQQITLRQRLANMVGLGSSSAAGSPAATGSKTSMLGGLGMMAGIMVGSYALSELHSYIENQNEIERKQIESSIKKKGLRAQKKPAHRADCGRCAAEAGRFLPGAAGSG